MILPDNDPLAVQLCEAIRTGDTETLQQHLEKHPNLAAFRILDGKGGRRSLLHVATDWPGHFPNVRATIEVLVAAGADPNARMDGPNASSETPLHWAASSDDVAALDALLDAGADIEADGAVIGGGTPMADAVGFKQWAAARRLLERGAKTTLVQAAGLGLLDRLTAYFQEDPNPEPLEITKAFWYACHGGQRSAAEFLLAKGADKNWVGWMHKSPLDTAREADAPEMVAWLREIGATSARRPSN